MQLFIVYLICFELWLLIYCRVVRWQLARRRQGTHASKRLDQVRGSTKKPHAQKGTGRARQGTRRAPHMRGGATVWGPVPRSHAFGKFIYLFNLYLFSLLNVN